MNFIPIGEMQLGEWQSDGARPTRVTCLHELADWDNFANGAKLCIINK